MPYAGVSFVTGRLASHVMRRRAKLHLWKWICRYFSVIFHEWFLFYLFFWKLLSDVWTSCSNIFVCEYCKDMCELLVLLFLFAFFEKPSIASYCCMWTCLLGCNQRRKSEVRECNKWFQIIQSNHRSNDFFISKGQERV